MAASGRENSKCNVLAALNEMGEQSEAKQLSSDDVFKRLNDATLINNAALFPIKAHQCILTKALKYKNYHAVYWILLQKNSDFQYFENLYPIREKLCQFPNKTQILKVLVPQIVNETKYGLRNPIIIDGTKYDWRQEDVIDFARYLLKMVCHEGLDEVFREVVKIKQFFWQKSLLIDKDKDNKTLVTHVLEGFCQGQMSDKVAIFFISGLKACINKAGEKASKICQRKDLVLAIQSKNNKVLSTFLNNFEPNLDEEKDNQSPLERTLMLGLTEMASILVNRQNGAKVNTSSGLLRGNVTYSPLLKKMANRGDIISVKELLKLGAAPAFGTSYSVLPLQESKESKATTDANEPPQHERVRNFLTVLELCSEQQTPIQTPDSTDFFNSKCKPLLEKMPNEDIQYFCTLLDLQSLKLKYADQLRAFALARLPADTAHAVELSAAAGTQNTRSVEPSVAEGAGASCFVGNARPEGSPEPLAPDAEVEDEDELEKAVALSNRLTPPIENPSAGPGPCAERKFQTVTNDHVQPTPAPVLVTAPALPSITESKEEKQMPIIPVSISPVFEPTTEIEGQSPNSPGVTSLGFFRSAPVVPAPEVQPQIMPITAESLYGNSNRPTLLEPQLLLSIITGPNGLRYCGGNRALQNMMVLNAALEFTRLNQDEVQSVAPLTYQTQVPIESSNRTFSPIG